MTTASATLTPELRAMLRAAGCTDRQIDLWQGVEEDRPRHPTGATAEQAIAALRLSGAPDSLTRALINARTSPRRIVAELIAHVGPGAKLAGTAATLLQARIKAESGATSAGIWAEYRAAHNLPAHNSLLPGYLQ